MVEPASGAYAALLAMVFVTACAGPENPINPVPSGAASSPALQTGCDDGFLAAADGESVPGRNDPAILRQRAVRIDASKLESGPARITLNLFDNACLVAVRDQASTGEAVGAAWTGTIEGVPGSSATFVIQSGVLIGSIVSPPKAYQVRPVRGDIYVVTEVDPSKYPNERNPGTP
jgi:hypothetical protein